MTRGGASALLFLTLAAILGATLLRLRGPLPAAADAPASTFSAARAAAFEREILGGDVRHPVGTAAHDAVRDRLAARLRLLGYAVTVQHGFACSPAATCAPVTNVIARTPGDARPDALVVATHYDSQPASSGVSDAGLGIAAIVETARATRNERFRNPVVFLITDAEEVALLGAEAFVADAASLQNAAAVINVEARGTSGPSFLFETSRRNEWIARAVARALPRPATSSLYYDIYELLPNDTDLTVFKRAGLAGIGFGNIGNPAQYHTPLDSFAHLDARTLQHHGDHVLAMTRALAAEDLRQTSRGNAVWFDVLSLFVIWWPQRASLPLAVGALVVLLIASTILVRERRTSAAAITVAVTSFFLTLVFAVLLALAGNWLAGLRSGGAVWVAQPGPIIAAAWLIGAFAALFVARRVIGYTRVDGLFAGYAICWSAIGIGLCFVLPGGSFLAIVPAIAGALLALLRATTRLSESAAGILFAAVAATLFFPLATSLYDALGGPILPFVAMLVALVATTFAPMVAAAELRNALIASLAAAALACVAMSNLVAPYTAASPRHINIEYVDDGAAPRWRADGLRPPMRRAAAFDPLPRQVSNWFAAPGRAFVAPAPPLGLAPVELRVVRDEHTSGTRRLTLELRSRRNAPRLSLIFHAPSLAALRIDGVAPPPRTRGRDPFAPGWHRAAVRGASSMTVELELGRDELIDAIVADSTYGLPPAGAPLARARDASIAVPVHDGDLTTTMRRLRL